MFFLASKKNLVQYLDSLVVGKSECMCVVENDQSAFVVWGENNDATKLKWRRFF